MDPMEVLEQRISELEAQVRELLAWKEYEVEISRAEEYYGDD